MRRLDPKTYIVRPSDTLSLIAKKSGLSSWKDIYFNPANAAFRVRRPDPNRLEPGDRILIPPSSVAVREVLQTRLANLIALRGQTDGLFAQIESDLDANIRKYDQVSQNADAAATVANLLAGLGTLVFKGMAAMKLSGSALTAANKELTKQTGELIVEPLKDPAMKLAADKIGANPGIVWAVGQITIQSWLNINSPSWWAGVVGNLQDGKSWSQAVTNDPMEALKATRNAIESQRQNTLEKIDDRIRATQVLLVGVSSRGLASLYDKRRHAVA